MAGILKMSNDIIYGVVKVIYSFKSNKRESYGIVAYENPDLNETPTVVASAYDLSNDESKVQALADMCNKEKILLIHFNDIISDFITKETLII